MTGILQRGELDTETDARGRKTIWRNGQRPCEDRDTRRMMPCEDRRRDWRTYKPRIAKNCRQITRSYQEVRKNHHLQVSEGARPCWHLILDFYFQNCMIISFSCFKSPCLWYFAMAAQANEYNDQESLFPKFKDGSVSGNLSTTVYYTSTDQQTKPTWHRIRWKGIW